MKTFEQAWAEKERAGYQYGHDALEQVRLGWEMREQETGVEVKVVYLDGFAKLVVNGRGIADWRIGALVDGTSMLGENYAKEIARKLRAAFGLPHEALTGRIEVRADPSMPRDEFELRSGTDAVRVRVKPPTFQTAHGEAETIGGTPYGEHLETLPSGQQKDYVVLTPEERAKGFVRPVRRSYIHEKCGTQTTMGQALAETYAREPTFYSGTFCCECGAHFPVGANGEFVWKDDPTQKVGT